MMNEWESWVRVINICLATFSIVLLLRKAALYWSLYQERTKDFWWVLMCWCLAIILGTLEILMAWGTEFRVLFTLGALLLTAKVMLKPNEVENPTFSKEL